MVALSASNVLHLDKGQAKRFLDTLFGEASDGEAFAFQTLDDNQTRKDPSLIKLIPGKFEDVAERLERLNQRGAGVYVTVNKIKPGRRLAANVTGVRALFIDLDGEPLEPVWDWTLPPHMVVESSPDENDFKDMGELVRGADQVRSATGAHVTFVHHTGKDNSKGARGHSLLNAAVDTEIEVWRSDAAEGAIGVTVTKQRELERGRGFAFKLVTKDLGKNRRGKTLSSCVVETTTVRPALKENEEQALETLKTLLIESDTTEVRIAEWQKAVLADDGFAAGQEAATRSRTFRRTRTNLKNKGYIEISGTNVTTRTP